MLTNLGQGYIIIFSFDKHQVVTQSIDKNPELIGAKVVLQCLKMTFCYPVGTVILMNSQNTDQ